MIKKTLFFIAIFGMAAHSLVAQIPLSGVVTVQNSKVNTGQTVHVPNVQVASQYAQPNATDNEGKFMLRFAGVESGRQVQLSVTPYGAFKDYVVVNNWDLNQTLGRKSFISIYVAKQEDLDRRKAEMVGINMEKYEARADKTIKRLQAELEIYKKNSDYMNVRYKEIRDSLQIVSQDITTAYRLIEEYAKLLVTQNLDDKEENYINAYHCFIKGELDSVKYYLKEDELDKKYQNLLQLKEESEKEKALAQVLTESVALKEERYEKGINDLIKEWLLLAQTAALQNNYEEAELYYEKSISADLSNAAIIYEFANYLFSIREYSKSENYYLKCLEIYRDLEQENPNTYLADIANVLNGLAKIHIAVHEYSRALEENNQALEIRRKLAAENPKVYLGALARTLMDLGVVYQRTKEYSKGLEVSEEALEILRTLSEENSKNNLADIAKTLNNLAITHYYIQEYPKALEKYENALEIRRKLSEENPKLYLPDVAQTLNNIALLHITMNELSKAQGSYEEALAIYRRVAEENPKAYLADVAMCLQNLAFYYATTNEHLKALEGYDEALVIYRKIAEENPKAYLQTIAIILQNIAYSHYFANGHSNIMIDCYEEVLDIYRKFAEENPNPFLFNVAISLQNLAEVHRNFNEYQKALVETHEALDIFRKLAEENQDYLPHVAGALNNLAGYYLYSQEYMKSEQLAQEAIAFDSTALLPKINLAHALLFQNRYSEAEAIYVELSQTILEEDESYAQSLLDDLEALEKAGAIPEERKADVEKIREILKNELEK